MLASFAGAAMGIPLLKTKLYIPPVRPKLVPRPRLIERLNAGLHRKLTLVSAPAGFGKTTLLSEWAAGCERPVAWLSLDEGDNDPARFLAYLVAALQTIEGSVGQGLLAVLQSPGPVNVEPILTTLLNEIASLPHDFILVLDDYHVIESQPVDKALTFTLDHLPPRMHLVIATRTDPILALSRLRARGQLTELRTADLRFTTDEAAAFLKQVIRLPISPDDVRTLENRTEGWITGLQLAAVAMQGLEQREQITHLIHSFSGSHHYVIDYLVDEVLDQQTLEVQEFLLQTSILDRMTASLCNVVAGREDSQAILERLEAANLFLIPLDNERCWYRYHHLFADLLRQRLHQSPPLSPSTSSGQAPPLAGGMKGGAWPVYTSAPARGTKKMAWRSKLCTVSRCLCYQASVSRFWSRAGSHALEPAALRRSLS
jgi:LuxR family maltose regulon positive regulatory protein